MRLIGGFIHLLFSIFSDSCVYVNLEFKGGDLSVIPSLSVPGCKEQCEKLKGCTFFSVNKLACILKDSNVEIRKKNGVVSGATDSTCGKMLLCVDLCRYLI